MPASSGCITEVVFGGRKTTCHPREALKHVPPPHLDVRQVALRPGTVHGGVVEEE